MRSGSSQMRQFVPMGSVSKLHRMRRLGHNQKDVSSGRLAQLGEHRVRNAGVGGSNPPPSTMIQNQGFRLSGHLRHAIL